MASFKKNVRCSSTRKAMERKRENQVESLLQKTYGKCGVTGGGCIEQYKEGE